MRLWRGDNEWRANVSSCDYFIIYPLVEYYLLCNRIAIANTFFTIYLTLSCILYIFRCFIFSYFCAFFLLWLLYAIQYWFLHRLIIILLWLNYLRILGIHNVKDVGIHGEHDGFFVVYAFSQCKKTQIKIYVTTIVFDNS